LTGGEKFTIKGIDAIKPGQQVDVEALSDDGKRVSFKTHARADNDTEVGYLHNGGVLPLVLRELISAG
jgi:aconitate hydratase